MLGNRSPFVSWIGYRQMKVHPIKRGICSVRCDASMNAARPEDQSVTLFKGEDLCLFAQNQGTGSNQNQFVGVDYSLGMDTMRW